MSNGMERKNAHTQLFIYVDSGKLRVSLFWLRQDPKESRCRLSVRASVRVIMLKSKERA